MHVTNHNWSARKQRLHLQSAAGISRHSALSENRIRQCAIGLRLVTRTQISFCKSPFPSAVPVPCENGSAETTVAEGGQNPVAGLWGRTLGEN